VTPEGMSGDLNVADAAVVLELEADLVAFSADLQRCDLSEHSDHWTRICPRLWSKVFQMSPHWLEAFPVPRCSTSTLPARSSAFMQHATHYGSRSLIIGEAEK
jgi:hypothetical protein